MKHKHFTNIVFTILVLLCSLALLAISIQLMWKLGIYTDEHNTSPAAVWGGELWNLLDWAVLLLAAVIAVLSCAMLMHRFISGMVFVCSLVLLAIGMKLMWNLGLYADAHSTSFAEIWGGGLWNLLSWARLLLTGVMAALSGAMLKKPKHRI